MFKFIFFLLCISHLISADEPEKILLITVPKSGTHLLRKALLLITHQRTHWIGLQTKRFSPENNLQRSHLITGAHLFPLFDQIRTHHIQKYKTILLIRDPRDVMLSFCNHLRRALVWTSCPTFDYANFMTKSFEDQLQETLTFPTEYLNPAICFPLVSLWMNEPSVFVCRFEDLVGSLGGGSDEKQLQTLSSLAEHIGYPCGQEKIQKIAQELFGGTWTFHQGQIGKWKEVYTEENCALFDSLYGGYAQQWGYE